jgi:RNA polymerase sigma-70 factor, ECF subfamily
MSSYEIVERNWEEFQRRLPGFFIRLGAHEQDIGDLVQETAYQLFRSYGKLEREEDFFRWGFGVAKYVLYHHYDNVTVSRKKQEEVQKSFDHSRLLNPEDTLITCLTIEDCLGELSDQEREIVTLKYLEGYVLEEISEKINLSKSQVDRILKRGLKKLHDFLDNP